jgi:hypothetical protein
MVLEFQDFGSAGGRLTAAKSKPQNIEPQNVEGMNCCLF